MWQIKNSVGPRPSSIREELEAEDARRERQHLLDIQERKAIPQPTPQHLLDEMARAHELGLDEDGPAPRGRFKARTMSGTRRERRMVFAAPGPYQGVGYAPRQPHGANSRSRPRKRFNISVFE